MKYALGLATYFTLGCWILVTISNSFQPEFAENNLTAWLVTVFVWSFMGAYCAREDR